MGLDGWSKFVERFPASPNCKSGGNPCQTFYASDWPNRVDSPVVVMTERP